MKTDSEWLQEFADAGWANIGQDEFKEAVKAKVREIQSDALKHAARIAIRACDDNADPVQRILDAMSFNTRKIEEERCLTQSKIVSTKQSNAQTETFGY